MLNATGDSHGSRSKGRPDHMARLPLLGVTLVVTLLAAAACGSSSAAGPRVASLGNAVTATPSPSASAGSREATLLQFSACMRSNGVTSFPDPTVDSDGNAMLPGLRRLDRNDPTVQKALRACQKYRNQLRQNFSPEQRQKLQDALLAYAGCMRANGYQMPDPTFGTPGAQGGQGGGPFGTRINRSDPAFTKADAVCRPKTLSGLRPGGAGRPSGAGPS